MTIPNNDFADEDDIDGDNERFVAGELADRDDGERPGVAGQTDVKRDLSSRWGAKDSILSRGWMAVPRNFFFYIGPLGLTATEALFILHLMLHKWSADAPYPSYHRIAERMGSSTIQARKIARQLEEKRFLKRIPRFDGERGNKSNAFDLQPFFDRLAAIVDSDIRWLGGTSQSMEG